MKTFSATTIINASPETVWKLLTDAPRYPEWDRGVDRFEGSIAPGETIRVFTKQSPKRAFPVKVLGFEPPRKMVWRGGMPLGLFKGERTFTLTPQGDGKTEFRVEEVFSGLLLPLIGRTLPDFNALFRDFAADLKQRAEKTHGA